MKREEWEGRLMDPLQGTLLPGDAEPVAPPPPILGWTSTRAERLRQIGEKAGTVAGLYRHAVDLLASSNEPANLILLSHCVREVFNRLADILGAKFPGFQGDRNRAVGQLTESWVANSLPTTPEIPGIDTSGVAVRSVQIPRVVFEHARRIVEAELAGGNANRQRSAFYVTGGAMNTSLDHPAVLVAESVQKFFAGRAHVGSSDRAQPSHDEIFRHFAMFEDVIDLCHQGWWGAQEDVQDIVASANRKVLISNHGEPNSGVPS